MQIRVLAFARMRELLGAPERTLDLAAGMRVRDAWSALAKLFPALDELAGSTRIARNGRVGAADDLLTDGDELALLPPVGGG
ncbi:MAG: MoaD/ThiS family protein [Candidatus Tumulicola sp.]